MFKYALQRKYIKLIFLFFIIIGLDYILSNLFFKNKQFWEYKKINNAWYKFKFDNEPVHLVQKNKFTRWEDMWSRVNSYIITKPSNILDIGSGIDAIAGIIDKDRPYFNNWENFKLNQESFYKNIDYLQFNFDGNETVIS